MSIVKMKRLRLFGMADHREELFRRLQDIGCVELIEPADKLTDPDWSALTRVSDTCLTEARADAATLASALSALDKYGKEKGGLLKARPIITKDQLFDEGVRASALAVARTIYDHEKHIASLHSEEAKLKGQKQALAPWLDLDVALDAPSSTEVSVTFGSLSTRTPLEELPVELHTVTELAELVYARRDAEAQHVLVLCHTSVAEEVFEVLKRYGFARSTLRDYTGTALENTAAIDARLLALEGELATAKKAVQALGVHRSELKLGLDRLNQDVRREEAKTRLLQSQSVLFLEGWVSDPDLPKLQEQLSDLACAWETSDPTEDDIPDVPVKLKNNAFTRPLSMVTEMYSLPAYDGVDPNPLMAPFFILFYGIMMADMGYGLVMMLISVIAIKKMRPKGTAGHLFALMGLCGISTFCMGAITGGFFGDFPTQLVSIISPGTHFALPALFTPLDDTLAILVGAMCLGFVQIITGMAISFVEKLKRGEYMDALWEEVTWWVVFIGGALAILGVTKIVLILSGIMILVGSGWTAKGFGKVTAVFGSLYNHVTGYFGDILSYSRLMALMLAGSVIAQVFNTLGAIPGNIIIFLIISFAGNTLNFGLNILGCYVHDLRLQCLEYFGKFYKDGGKAFQPLNVNTKYVDVE